ncbi:hypothetical protein Nepgr_026627 [Nepenthes gracilis]|uniref:Uncharacterized protein n=1 Tax=Nepenthes gracilis TaxID=150966 RepID=A0AAD3T9C0_NEPGR|nr:hypothetical protein Nepgr_026627 [Nepenthes gracilis]
MESDCHASLPPINSYGKSSQLPDSVAEEAMPQPEPITTPIAVLHAELVSGAEIETPAPPIADSLALTSPNYPIHEVGRLLLKPHGLAMSKYHGWSLRTAVGVVAFQILLPCGPCLHILCGFWGSSPEAKTAGCGSLSAAWIERLRLSLSTEPGWPSAVKSSFWVVLLQNGRLLSFADLGWAARLIWCNDVLVAVACTRLWCWADGLINDISAVLMWWVMFRVADLYVAGLSANGLQCRTVDPGAWILMMDGTPKWVLIMLAPMLKLLDAAPSSDAVEDGRKVYAEKALGWLDVPFGRNPEAGALLPGFAKAAAAGPCLRLELHGPVWMLTWPACLPESGLFSSFWAIVALQQFAFCCLILKDLGTLCLFLAAGAVFG